MNDQSNQATPNPLAHSPAAPGYYRDDEISLVDLWLVLARRKRLIAAIVAASIIVGLLLALTRPVIYEYVTSIEIGTRLVREDLRPIDQPDTVLAKIQESYVPAVLQRHRQEHPEDQTDYKIGGRIPSKSEIIVLEAKGSVEQRDVYLALLSQVVEMVKADHQRIYDVLKKEIEIKRNKTTNLLASLQDEAKFLASEVERVKETKKLLEQQIAEAKKLLAKSEENRLSAVKRIGNESNAMTIMLLDNEIRMTREELGKLEERLKVQLESNQDELAKKIADNLRLQSEKSDELAKLDVELANFQETRPLVEPMQSLRPVGPRRSLIVVLALVLGGILAVFAAFFTEFLKQVRQSQTEGMFANQSVQ